ncbi:hypothetical protein [Paraclostridium bifermentans]|uniref:hypothetical protein n=1 Tax=Paraclostridium bifermentans TaxID=1490 RepID=UPI00359CADB6
MNNKFSNKEYAWNDAMILDKIQEILEGKNLDDLEFTEEELANIKNQLSKSISEDEINESAYIVAENIDELKVLDNEDIKDYIVRLKNYLDETTLKCIRAEFKGIDFEVYKDSSVDDVFKEYYSKYDEIYGISDMLSDLGIMKR